MINFDTNEQCCGCSACANICVRQAITMKHNQEGFLMPVVDASKCNECGLCEQVCPYLKTEDIDVSSFSLADFNNHKAYLYYSKDEARKMSASGGFVYDVMRQCLSKGGIVCGCVWDTNMNAIHVIVDNLKDLTQLQSSKYVQSDINTCYKQIRQALRDERSVVFCGTPCQTAGLNGFLGKLASSPNLLSICLICHGVPSPAVWQGYKKSLEKKYGGQMVACNMRDKRKKGYKQSHVRYEFVSDIPVGSVGRAGMSVVQPTFLRDPYIFLFTDNLYLRNSCYHCHYKGNNSHADIIVGDFYASTKGAENDGCSCLLAMTEKGFEFINSLNGVVKPSTPFEVGSVNCMLFKSVSRSGARERFFKEFTKENDTLSLLNKYLPVRFKIKRLLNQIGVFDIVRKIVK